MATAEEWIEAICKANWLDWNKLTPGQRFKVVMEIPCPVRCFRVGEPVEVAVGQRCPECGRVHHARMTRYDHINREGAL